LKDKIKKKTQIKKEKKLLQWIVFCEVMHNKSTTSFSFC
jgi:hypothetical protein